jgi:hypothetical protein
LTTQARTSHFTSAPEKLVFGLKRKRATKAAVEAAQPILRMLEAGGLDAKALWSDPYFLGFMQAFLARRIRVATKDAVFGADLLAAVAEAFGALSGRSGVRIVRRTAPLVDEGNPAYAEGYRNAEKIILIAHGSRAFEGEPDVARAIEVARTVAPDLVSSGLADDKSSGVAAVLMKKLLLDRLKERQRQSPPPG